MFTLKNDCRDHYGNSPLHLAAENGYTQTIKSLLGVHSHILNNKNSEGVSISQSDQTDYIENPFDLSK